MKFVAERDDRLEQRAVMFALQLGTHEGSVDLDDSRKQQCEVGERRVSSTEVVKREANSDSTQMRHRVNCFGDIEQRHAFCDFDDETLGRHPTFRERALNHRYQARIVKLVYGEVDREKWSRALSANRLQERVAATASRIAKEPSSNMRSLCSASGMNTSGGIDPRSGCCQRINASKPTTSTVERSIMGW